MAKEELAETVNVHGIATPSLFFAVNAPTIVPAGALSATVELLMVIVMYLSEFAIKRVKQSRRRSLCFEVGEPQ